MSNDVVEKGAVGFGRLVGGVGGSMVGGAIGAGVGGAVNYFRKDKDERTWKDTAKGALAGGAIGGTAGGIYYGVKGGRNMRGVHQHLMHNDEEYRNAVKNLNKNASVDDTRSFFRKQKDTSMYKKLKDKVDKHKSHMWYQGTQSGFKSQLRNSIDNIRNGRGNSNDIETKFWHVDTPSRREGRAHMQALIARENLLKKHPKTTQGSSGPQGSLSDYIRARNHRNSIREYF